MALGGDARSLELGLAGAVAQGLVIPTLSPGNLPWMLGVLGGEIHMYPGVLLSAASAIKTGKMRTLAAMGLKRIPVLPDLPTVAEQGFPGFKIVNSYSLYAPAGTPKPILLALSRAVGEFMASPKMSQKLISEGSHPPDGAMTPDEFRAYTLREYAEVALGSMREARDLVKHYFTLAKQEFIRRYFAGREEVLKLATSEESWRSIVEKLSADLRRVIAMPEIHARLVNEGGLEPVGSTAEAFAAICPLLLSSAIVVSFRSCASG